MKTSTAQTHGAQSFLYICLYILSTPSKDLGLNQNQFYDMMKSRKGDKMKKSMSFLLAICLTLVSFTALAKDVTVELDGKQLVFDQNPIIENDRTLVPVRKIFEELGATVTWFAPMETVSATKDNTTIRLQINSNFMYVNNVPRYLDVAPKIVGDRTLVPLRAISEAFGSQVEWMPDTKTVVITTQAAEESTPSVDTSSPEAQDFEKQVLALVNTERQNAGLSALSWNDDAAKVARAHSKDMSDRGFFDHTNPDGLSPFDRMKNAGISYRRAAENIAAGQSTPEAVMNGWMNSEGHRSNILNPDLKEIGVGYYKGETGYRHYWTQVFITK